MVAFAVGAKYVAGNGLIIVGTHTDSPHLRLKPTSKITSQGVLQMGVQTYGGGLWSTWFDRDLSVAGSVVLRGANGALQRKLLKIARPICRVPMLAVHLNVVQARKLRSTRDPLARRSGHVHQGSALVETGRRW